MQVLTIEVEVLLGLWLLSGLARKFAWYTTLLFFCILTCLSFTLAWQGQTDCGCFGKVKVNPWWTFGLDVGIASVMVAVSWFTRWDDASPSRAALAPGGVWQSLVQVTLLTASLLGLIALGFVVSTDDPWATLAYYRGEPIEIAPMVTRLGSGLSGEERTFNIQLRNNTGKAINIVGGTASCSCIAIKDLPISIAPYEAKSLSITIYIRGSVGVFKHIFAFITDIGSIKYTAYITGRVLEVPP